MSDTTMTDLENQYGDALECPTCGAEPGVPCRRVNDHSRRAKRRHVARTAMLWQAWRLGYARALLAERAPREAA